MKNYIKIMFAVILILFIGVTVFAVITYEKEDNTSYNGENSVILNDIAKYAEEKWSLLNSTENGAKTLEFKDYGIDFCILNQSNDILYDSRGNNLESERLSVETAINRRYPYKYILSGGRAVGSVILFDDGLSGIKSAKIKLMIGMAVCGLVLLAAMILFYIYVDRNIIVPFRKMEDFAGKVAEGRLDEPLAMNRNNMFGVFSESFDIMREELSESKKRELALQKKERELVASLSHDLKTPITGIKLTSELLQAKLSMIYPGETKDIQELTEKLSNIYKKADQIDVLVSDLFAATLDDLGEFRVSLKDEASSAISGIIGKYDDACLVKQEAVPEVIVSTDLRRLSQVIGNIITNSYKYAGTGIDVSYKITEGYLKMSIRDYGPGVPESEIDLITNKFYRGKDWKDGDLEGSGLGLYIAKTLMEKMNGELIAESVGKGLTITLLIPLS